MAITIAAKPEWLAPPDVSATMFGGDPLITKLVDEYRAKIDFACAVETGLGYARTTPGLAVRFPRVFTVEVLPEMFAQHAPLVREYGNVSALLGNSARVLQRILPELRYPLFALLDAHGPNNWPLRDELTTLLAVKQPKLIVVHDFRVPGRGFGFDVYDGKPCDFDYIGDVLPHDECRYRFNHAVGAESHQRGVLIIEHLLEAAGN